MKDRRVWPIVVIAVVLGFTLGGLSVGAWLLGPGGFRHESAARPTASPTAGAAAVTAPSPRSDAAMAFDTSAGKLVLFGGHAGNSPQTFGDTWTWNGTRWTQVETASGPVARWGASMAYDSVRRAVVLHGALLGGAAASETWTWDGTRWLLMSPDQAPPVFDYGYEPTCWDSVRGLVLLFADTDFHAPYMSQIPEWNQTWAWDGRTWTQRPAPGAPSGHGSQPAAIAFDTARKSTVFFGHVKGTPTTWTFDGAAWRQASTSGSGSNAFAMAEDGARSDVVLFGENRDTWTWDGATWTVRNPVHSPPARFGAAMAYDSAHRVVVLFGGSTVGGGVAHDFNDTWTWNGSDWTQVSPGG